MFVIDQKTIEKRTQDIAFNPRAVASRDLCRVLLLSYKVYDVWHHVFCLCHFGVGHFVGVGVEAWQANISVGHRYRKGCI